MKTIKLALLILSMCFSLNGTAQWNGILYSGYKSTLMGGGFLYHSPDPEVTSSMLVRSVDSSAFIEWETADVTITKEEREVRFIWMFGIDANADVHRFRIQFNGNYILTFSGPVISSTDIWEVRGEEGSRMQFLPTMLDKYDDPMGFVILTIPAHLLINGKPQVIRVSGEPAGSRTWYMTFETPVGEKMRFIRQEAIRRAGDRQYMPVLFTFTHLREPCRGTIRVPGMEPVEFSAETGYNEVTLMFPAASDTVTAEATVSIDGKPDTTMLIELVPVRPWRIFLVQHTHTDIGYTRPQTEILPEHLRYIDYALDFCDQTDSLPVPARFRWTCETSWAVREYLRSRPTEQVDRLRKRVAEGRIELTALFLNGSDLSDEATLAAMLQPVAFLRKNGMSVVSAMQSDINGVPWCLTDYLPGAGIQTLTMAQNTHRARKPFEIPTLFWWESPSGSRLMVNRPEHYMFGNLLGILTNTGTFATNLFRHLQEISAKGYPYDIYSIQFSGYLTDNSPPSTKACDLVKEWNEIYVWPELQLATISGFLTEAAERFSDKLPVVRAAWPDWWMDGFGSAAIETAWARKAHAEAVANSGLMAMALLMGDTLSPGIRLLHERVAEDLAFYDEHTFGAAESIWDPLCWNSVVQLGQKVSFVWDAVKTGSLLREEVMGRIQDRFPRAGVPTVAVVNTLTAARSGMVDIYIDHEILPRNRSFRIEGPGRDEISAQAWQTREDGTWWTLFLPHLPPFGYQSFRIRTQSDPAVSPPRQPFSGTMENKWYRVTWDTAGGRLSGILDKELNAWLTDASSEYFIGEFIYERLGRNRAQLEQFTLVEYNRTTPARLVVKDYVNGKVWQSFTISGQIPGCATDEGLSCEIRLYHHEKLLEFRYSMKKLPVTDPEGGYVAFPLNLRGGRVFYEVAGGPVQAGVDEIPGASADWQGIQNFVSVRNDSLQILITSPEIPLVHFYSINLGNFSRVPRLWSSDVVPPPHFYSWVFNNYWTTNFLASQEGEIRWTYRITSLRDTSLAAAARFGYYNRVPLLTRIFPAGKEGPQHPQSLLGATPPDILPVSIRPSGDWKGVVLHLRETAGHPARLTVDDPLSSFTPLLSGSSSGLPRKLKVTEINVLEEEITPVSRSVEFRPYQTRFLKLDLLPETP